MFFTSDSHYGHKRILEYCPTTRKYDSIEEHNEALIKAWNDRVGVNDDVYHLGDVSFMEDGKTNFLLSRLKGKIHLILGNHDRYERFVMTKNIVGIDQYKEVKVTKKLAFMLFHFPIESWNKKHHGSIHLHGHTHGNPAHHPSPKAGVPGMERRMDVGVDCHKENAPFSVEEILTYLGVTK